MTVLAVISPAVLDLTEKGRKKTVFVCRRKMAQTYNVRTESVCQSHLLLIALLCALDGMTVLALRCLCYVVRQGNCDHGLKKQLEDIAIVTCTTLSFQRPTRKREGICVVNSIDEATPLPPKDLWVEHGHRLQEKKLHGSLGCLCIYLNFGVTCRGGNKFS